MIAIFLLFLFDIRFCVGVKIANFSILNDMLDALLCFDGSSSCSLSNITESFECSTTVQPSSSLRCNGAGAVVHFHVGSNRLIGTLPSELGKLTLLQELYVQSNHLNGTLPNELKLLTKLAVIAVQNNSFIGEIPSLSTTLMSCQLQLNGDSNCLVCNFFSNFSCRICNQFYFKIIKNVSLPNCNVGNKTCTCEPARCVMTSSKATTIKTISTTTRAATTSTAKTTTSVFTAPKLTSTTKTLATKSSITSSTLQQTTLETTPSLTSSTLPSVTLFTTFAEAAISVTTSTLSSTMSTDFSFSIATIITNSFKATLTSISRSTIAKTMTMQSLMSLVPTGVIVGIVIGVLLIIVAIGICLYRRRRHTPENSDSGFVKYPLYARISPPVESHHNEAVSTEYGRVVTKAHESQYNETSLAANIDAEQQVPTNNNVYQELVLSAELKQSDEPNYGQSSFPIET